MVKLFREIKRYQSITSTGCLFILFISTANSGTLGTESVTLPAKIYIGAFGGGGAVTKVTLSQYATAFYSESKGGPLAVNAIGASNSTSVWGIGAHVGYAWPSQLLEYFGSTWIAVPAAELEGYYLGGATLQGNDLHNGTTRLPDHNFRVTYPQNIGVFLVNGKLSVRRSQFDKWHPYLGLGIGTAVISISGAQAIQRTPSEPEINHYSSDSSAETVVFAAQPKVGIHFDLNSKTSLFVEYRFLYLSGSDYTFGSTVYPTHVATSNWHAKIGSQYYNMGTVGIQYDL